MQDDKDIPPCLDLVRDKVLTIIQQSQLKTFLGKHWLDRFVKRYSELQVRFSQCLEYQRSAASNLRVLEHYFKLWHKMLKEYKIKEANI